MKREREHNTFENETKESETMSFVEGNQSDSLPDQTSGIFVRFRIISDEEWSRLIYSIKAKGVKTN